MPKSSSRKAFGRGNGTVTVIEQQVHRSAIRKAKIAFWTVGVIVALLTAAVAASYTHPIAAVAIGILTGVVVAAPIAGLILIWPVLRVLWWWIPEVITAAGLITGWVELAAHTSLIIRLMATAAILAPAAIPAVRTYVMTVIWCFITRHRLRVCFNEFIITNRTGSLPLILWARPTPAGERIWIWVRPGLSLEALQERLDKIAPACWADTVTIERASDTNAAYLRLDIKRRQVLTATIGSPLVELIDPNTPATERDTAKAPTALDLTDVTPESVTTPAKTAKQTDTRTPKPAREPVTTPATAGGEDVSDWI
jgi:hypothetical protein